VDFGALLNLELAAAYCRRAVSTIRSWIHRGLVHAVKRGRRTMVTLGDLIEAEARTNATRAKRGGRSPACAV
jgi:hypothetical protein